MATAQIQINVNNLRYLIAKRYIDLADQLLYYQYYYIGSEPSIFDLFTTVMLDSLSCADSLDTCTECLMSSLLNKYKTDEL